MLLVWAYLSGLACVWYHITQFISVSWFRNSDRRLWYSKFWNSFGGKFKICLLHSENACGVSDVTKGVISMNRFVLRSWKNIEMIIWAIFWLYKGWRGVPCALSCAEFENLYLIDLTCEQRWNMFCELRYLFLPVYSYFLLCILNAISSPSWHHLNDSFPIVLTGRFHPRLIASNSLNCCRKQSRVDASLNSLEQRIIQTRCCWVWLSLVYCALFLLVGTPINWFDILSQLWIPIHRSAVLLKTKVFVAIYAAIKYEMPS